MRPHPRMAETDASDPRAWGTCERCGFIGNLYKFRWQLEWRGVQLYNTRHLVCEWCEDTPQRQLGTVFIPPDPPPVLNARVEPYNIDEYPVSTRYTVNGQIRVVRYQPYPVMRIVNTVGNVPSTPLPLSPPAILTAEDGIILTSEDGVILTSD
jgi:hypothetical protein